MHSILFILLLVAIAYIGADRAFRVRQLPFLLSCCLPYGIEFLLLGVLLGPQALGWIDLELLRQFGEPIAIVLAFVGMVFGLQFRLRTLKILSKATYRIAASQAIITFVLMVPAALAVRLLFPDLFAAAGKTLPAVFALASVACVSAPTAVTAVIRRLKAHGRTSHLLRTVTSLDALVGICLYGVTLPFFGLEGVREGGFVPGIMWIVIVIGLGVALGLLSHFFLSLKLTGDERLAIAVGVLVFISGVAAMLDVSPLFLGLIVGVTLTNASPQQDKLYRLLVTAKKPLYVFMLMLSGSMWIIEGPVVIGAAILFVLLRTLAKMVGARLAFRSIRHRAQHPCSFGLALTGQGGIGLALALDFATRFGHAGAHLVLAIVLIAFVINGIANPICVRRLLAFEGEVA